MGEKKCRKIVLDRAESMCERCTNVSRGITVHHRVKKSHGGPWTPSNCVVLCGHGTTSGGCHSWVEHNPDAAEETGFHVRPWNDPAKTPILWRGSTWVYLLDDGTMMNV